MLLLALMLLPQIAPAARPSPTGVVTGQLLNTNSQPAADVRVRAIAMAEPGTPTLAVTELFSGVTDKEGRYRLADLPPGRYYVIAGLIDIPTYYPGVREMKDAIGISIGPNTTTELDFKMVVSDGFTVSGRIAARSDRPLTQKLTITMNAPGRYLTADVSANGAFEFTHIVPGAYVFMVLAGESHSMLGGVRVVDQDIAGLTLVLPLDITKN